MTVLNKSDYAFLGVSMNYIQKSVPFHLQVYEIIREKILSGELKSGERIYENKISQELGVSRSPVREALRMLEQDEFLVLSPSSGLVVNPMNFKDMEEIYQCRMVVEPFAARLALERIDEKDISALQQYVKEAKEYHNKKQFNKVIEANTYFHDLIVDKCQNTRLKAFIQKTRSLAILSRVSEFQCYQREDGYLAEHEAILEAIILKDENEVENRLRDHIVNDYVFFKEQFNDKN